jgi:hypothetical protein
MTKDGEGHSPVFARFFQKNRDGQEKMTLLVRMTLLVS